MKLFTDDTYMAIFLDTSFLIPFYNEKDTKHEKTLELIKACKSNKYGKIFTSYDVLDELLTYIQRKVSKSLSAELAKYWIVEKKGFADLLPLNEEDRIQAADLFTTQENERKPLSYTDCSIVIICQKLHIDNLATFDSQFSSFLTVHPRELGK
ncbi:MAG: type II toxin-antitoxin system VapC family toxin [Candidatus Heimdallarchaeota archaeon]